MYPAHPGFAIRAVLARAKLRGVLYETFVGACGALRVIDCDTRDQTTTQLSLLSAANAFASSLGLAPADFLKTMGARPTTEDVAKAVVECASDPQERAGKAFLVSSAGVTLVS